MNATTIRQRFCGLSSGNRNLSRAAIVAVVFAAGCSAQNESDRAGGQQIETASGGLTATGAQHLTELRPSAIPPSRPWGKPVHGDEVSTLAEAEAAIDFEPLAPTKLGHPAAIIVNPQHELAFVYDHPTFGIFYIREQPIGGAVGVSEATIEKRATMPCPRPSGDVPHEGPGRCNWDNSLEVLADGRKAALWLTDQGANTIEFVDEERALWIHIIGQQESFDSATAVEVSNLLIG